jgi:hypothetical protein
LRKKCSRDSTSDTTTKRSMYGISTYDPSQRLDIYILKTYDSNNHA